MYTVQGIEVKFSYDLIHVHRKLLNRLIFDRVT